MPPRRCGRLARMGQSLTLLLAIASLAACSHKSPPTATPPVAPPAASAPAGPQSSTDLAGLWYVYLKDMPWMALRVQVLSTPSGPSISWITFDWTASADAEHLGSASKPVSVKLKSQPPEVSLEGPAPMLTVDGQPNGQQGSWHLELHAPPEGPTHFLGTAVCDELTAPAGTPAEMTRDWRSWKRP